MGFMCDSVVVQCIELMLWEFVVCFIVFVICLILVVFFIVQVDDFYIVINVVIDVSVDNVLMVQIEVMCQGQELVVYCLIECLMFEEDWFEMVFDFMLCMNEFGEMVQDNVFDFFVVVEMILGIEIQNEQCSVICYLVDLMISFDLCVVEWIFLNYGVFYVEVQFWLIMVLLIFNEGGQFLFWEDNVWCEVW